MNLRQKNTIPSFIIMIAIFAVGSLVTVNKLNELKKNIVSRPMENSMEVLLRSVEFTAQQTLEKSSLFSRLPQVIKAFELAHSGDIDDPRDEQGQLAREMLRRELRTAMDGYEIVTGNGPMKLHFHLPNGRSLVRMWRQRQIRINGKWEDRSDDISDFRHTVLDVNTTGKPVRGIELGRGGFVIRGLSPIMNSQGRPLGSVEVLFDFAPLVKTLFANNHYFVRLYMNKQFLSITHRLQDAEKYPVVKDRYVQVMGRKTEDGTDGKWALSLMNQGKTDFAIQMNGRKAMAAFPIKDYKASQIGVMTLETDMTEEYALVRNIIVFQVMMLFLVVIALGVLSSLFLSRTVLKPVSGIMAISQQLSKGDLRNTVEVTSKDEMGLLSETVNFMVQSVREMVGKLVEVVTRLTANSDQINKALQDQVSSASEQSASVSEITSTMAEFSASSRQIAEHADTVLTIAEEALNQANEGEKSVSLVTGKMEDIHTGNENTVKGIHELGNKTREIAKIMEIINNIADQTKLIAFNAALEASSAGEAGKRFGVVAVEIRRLAENVEASTRETEKRVIEIQDAVDNMMLASEKNTGYINEGLSFTSHTRETLANIVGRSQDTRDAAQQITLSTQQQKTASDQVVQALREIDESGRHTTRAIKQIGDNGETLNQLAEQLDTLIHGFKL
ncbi:MAG: methyl-accepting chemotaxis protein [Desulfobacteraceae bacterium]|nr:methyl-accepting chemotaxis protein [Desulfobacteraceae bacterium]